MKISNYRAMLVLAVLNAIPMRCPDGHTLDSDALSVIWPLAARLQRHSNDLEQDRISIVQRATADIPGWPEILRRWREAPDDAALTEQITQVDRRVSGALGSILDQECPVEVVMDAAITDKISTHLLHLAGNMVIRVPVVHKEIPMSPDEMLRVIASVTDLSSQH